MEEMNFRPRKVVLVFWLIAATLGSLIVGAILAGVCAEGDILSPLLGFGIGGFFTWVISSLRAILYFYSIKYILNDRYISKSSGIIWKKKRSIPLEKITNIDVRQGPLERLFGFGQIWIFTPSTGAATPEEKLIGISAPHDMKEIIVEHSESSKDNTVSSAPVVSSTTTSADASLLKDIKDSLLRIEELLKNSHKST